MNYRSKNNDHNKYGEPNVSNNNSSSNSFNPPLDSYCSSSRLAIPHNNSNNNNNNSSSNNYPLLDLIYPCKVTRIESFGSYMAFPDHPQVGFAHKSKLSEGGQSIKLGDIIDCKVIEINTDGKTGKIKLQLAQFTVRRRSNAQRRASAVFGATTDHVQVVAHNASTIADNYATELSQDFVSSIQCSSNNNNNNTNNSNNHLQNEQFQQQQQYPAQSLQYQRLREAERVEERLRVIEEREKLLERREVDVRMAGRDAETQKVSEAKRSDGLMNGWMDGWMDEWLHPLLHS